MNNTKIMVLVGTKAQFVKMAPVLLALDEIAAPYSLVYTGQHSETFDAMEVVFGIRGSDHNLIPNYEADTHLSFFRWTVLFWVRAFRKKFRKLWRDHEVFVVHGDTASTLYGACLGRIFRKKVAHVEAGLRSPTLWDPIPEEIIRRFVSRIAEIHYCPDDWSCSNLHKVSGRVVNTHGNTLHDSLQLALKRIGVSSLARKGNSKVSPYGIASIHRNENLTRSKRLQFLVDSIIEASEGIPIKFVMHPATRKRLERNGLLEKLSSCDNIQLLDRMDYFEFVALMVQARFLLTDGGSNQEESAELGIPCLLLRIHTERRDGLGKNVELSCLKPDRIREFVDRHRSAKWDSRIDLNSAICPSLTIATSLKNELS